MRFCSKKLSSILSFLPTLFAVTMNSVKAPSTCSSSRTYRAIILDFGDVLFTWSKQIKSTISGKLLKQMMSSPTWGDFECGRISRAECYSKLGERYHVDPKVLEDYLSEARKTLTYDPTLIMFVRSLKEEYGISVFAMSNIGHEDYAHVRDHAHEVDWDVFDRIFPSYAAGSRKPDISFYQHVIANVEHDVKPSELIYVDDKIDNVITARSFGMQGVVFRSSEQIMQIVQNLIRDPIERAYAYLTKNAGHHESFTNTGIVIAENFAQYLILDVTGDKYVYGS